MLESVQFLYLEDTSPLPVKFLNCGHASVNTPRYCWDGEKRIDSNSTPLAIWQYTVSGCGAIDIDGKTTLLKPGMAFLVTVPDKHTYYLPENSSHWEFLYLTGSGFALIELTYAMQQKFGKILQHSAQSPTVRKTLEIIREYQEKPPPVLLHRKASLKDFSANSQMRQSAMVKHLA